MDEKAKLLVHSFGSDRTKLNEPISEHVATHLGGPALVFFVASHTREIIRMADMARELKLPVLVVGSGTKMAISDQGFDGVVIKNRTSNIVVVGVKGKVSKVGIGVSEAMVEIDSGVTISKLVEFLKAQSLDFSQIENIPGTIGGNLSLNRSVLELAQKIKVLDEDGEKLEINAIDLRPRRYIVLSAVLKFKSNAV